MRAARNCLPVTMFDMDQPPFICRWKANWFFALGDSVVASDSKCSASLFRSIGRITDAIIPSPSARTRPQLSGRRTKRASSANAELHRRWVRRRSARADRRHALSPHPRQRPDGECAALQINHSTTQQAKACASAFARGSPPSNSMMPARSSKKTCQASADQPSRPGRSRATILTLCRESALRTGAGGAEAAFNARSSPSSMTSTSAARAVFRASAAFIPAPSN
jgi:hypothetical protein